MEQVVAGFDRCGSNCGQNASFLPDFSATEIQQISGREIASKIYLSGLNFRSESAPGYATIDLPSRNMRYRIFNHTNCIEIPGRAKIVASPLQLFSGQKMERKPGGTEVVEGHPCKVEDVLVTAADGVTTRLKLWEATDLKGAPVKIELFSGRGALITTYRDIVEGIPDPALFTPPKNCRPFEKTYQIAPPEKGL
jgi:hypothetical protein